MDATTDKRQAAVRLALCGGGAALLYALAIKLPVLEPHKPWLEEHRIQTIGLAAAALFGLSLALAPLSAPADTQEPSPYGYEPVE